MNENIGPNAAEDVRLCALDPKIPNAASLRAMEELESGGGKRLPSIEALFQHLDI